MFGLGIRFGLASGSIELRLFLHTLFSYMCNGHLGCDGSPQRKTNGIFEEEAVGELNLSFGSPLFVRSYSRKTVQTTSKSVNGVV